MKECKTTCPMSVPTGLILLGFLLFSIGYIYLTPKNVESSSLFSLPVFVAGIVLITVGLCVFGYTFWRTIRCGKWHE